MRFVKIALTESSFKCSFSVRVIDFFAHFLSIIKSFLGFYDLV